MLVGKKVGPFIIDKELGRGAMGAVYRAYYTKMGMDVALKIINTGLESDPMSLARFEREAEILKKLSHPNIVKLFGTGRLNKTPFYIMEYIEGDTLGDLLQRRGRISWEDLVPLGEQICAALQHAHEQSVVHRDLKPGNIMMKSDGTAKLTDFGIAKALHVEQLTATNCAIGTAAYMSPEQCRGERNLTGKSDLYSLGIMFYELLTGRVPFMAESTLDMFLAHTDGKFERPSRLVLEIPIWLDTLVCQMLEKNPEKRPLNAAMVATSLTRIQEKVSAQRSAGADMVSSRVSDRPRRDLKLDDTDREAAHLIRTGAVKKKSKPKSTPFYQTGLFQIIAIPALLAAVGGAIYLATRPPRPEVLFERARSQMASKNPDDWEIARDGVIKDYLRLYSDRNDEQAKQVRLWADQVDGTVRERQLHKRLAMHFTAEGEGETTARAALHAEKLGDLSVARQRWQSLVKYRDSTDEDERPWGVVAIKRLAVLAEVEKLDLTLYNDLETARDRGVEFQPENEAERKAVLAKRYEMFGDLPLANVHWEKVRDLYRDDADQRLWFLLAAQKVFDGKNKPGLGDAEAAQKRLDLIQKVLDQSQKLADIKPDKVRGLLREILTLYGDNTDPEVIELVKQARDLQKKLPGARG